MYRRALRAAVAAIIFAGSLASLVSAGQAATATLTGIVLDQTGARVGDAQITATDEATQIRRQTVSSLEGVFTFAALPPGRYQVRAVRQGFAPVELRDVVLNVNDRVAIRIDLTVEKLGEDVNVVASPARVSTSAAVGTVVDRQFVQNLPLNGRSFHALLELTPGVVVAKTNFASQGQFSVNGQRTSANSFIVDGVSANVGVGAGTSPGQIAAGALPGGSAFGSTNSLVSVDALQEFRIETSSFAPEFGRMPGAQISVVTRSGSNALHGSVFNYFRNDALDANDWFANSRGLKKPALRQNDFGGVAGGPLMRSRTFFFFSYEGLRLRQPQFALAEVPTPAARQLATAGMRPYLDALPVPNGRPLSAQTAEFDATFSIPSNLDATSIRVDSMKGQRMNFFARYNYAPSNNEQRTAGLSTIVPLHVDTQTLTGAATLIIGTRATNDLRVNWSASSAGSVAHVDGLGGSVQPGDSAIFPGFASSSDSFLIFQIGPGGQQGFFNAGSNSANSQRQLNLVDTFSVVSGAHQVKVGVDYRRLSPIFNPRKYAQTVRFTDLASAQAGTAATVSVDAEIARRVLVFSNLSLYAQDAWQMSSRMTVTYGLRWEYNPPFSEITGHDPLTVANLDNPAAWSLAPAGTEPWQATHNDFAPRAGVVYRVSESARGSTIVRGGGGLFYDLGNGQGPAAAASRVFPYTASKALANVPFPLSSAAAEPASFTLNPPYGLQMVAFDPNLRLPYTAQWNAAVERSFASGQTFSASYVGAAGRRLIRSEVFVRANPNFPQVNVSRNAASSNYRALQLQFQRRLSRGLQALASYTWAHATDNSSDEAAFVLPASVIGPSNDEGPSDFDIRHTFTAATTYMIPTPGHGSLAQGLLGGWWLDAIFRARSAGPINVIARQDSLASALLAYVRPDVVSGQPFWLDDPTAPGGRRINPGAFVAPPAGRQGTLARNALRGFPVRQIDLAVRRGFDLPGRPRAEFRAEFFNLFNHPNFADPTSLLTNAFFGRSTQMLGRSLGTGGLVGGFNPLYQIGGPRSAQIALKVSF